MSAGAGGLASEALARVREFREAVRLLHADPSEVRALADRRLAAVVEAARTVEPYRSLWASLGEIRTVKDLTRLPITERAHLQDAPIESRLTCPPDGLVWQSTSGSTAAFLTTAWSREEDRSIQVQGEKPDGHHRDGAPVRFISSSARLRSSSLAPASPSFPSDVSLR